MRPAVRVQHLSKRYRIGAPTERYPTLRFALARAATAPARLFKRRDERARPHIWALEDVSFEVARGEAVGVIGRNGAGKSTLLKILSRVTKPTRGRVELRGRVGSLLEVGTGFHSELSGRENIYLSGAVLGMRRAEISKKFDEIVAFAEIDKFLDTPIKHYSSGMYVRLAFAVAAYLEPEILIADEVLAVGDAAFQRKCLGKMGDAARHGRTVLFVSHDLNAVNSFCTRAVLLHNGSLVKSGPVREVTAYYLDAANRLFSPVAWSNRVGAGELRLLSMATGQGGAETSAVSCREPFELRVDYELVEAVRGLRLFVVVSNDRGEVVFTTSDADARAGNSAARGAGAFSARVRVPADLLKAGSYRATFAADARNDRPVFAAAEPLPFEVFDPEDDTLAGRHARQGVVAPVLRWEIEKKV